MFSKKNSNFLLLSVEMMHGAYRTELNLIEEAIEAERRLVMEANAKRWEMLYKQCTDEEEANLQRRIRLSEEYQKTSQKMRIEFEERFREMKILLENQSEALEREIEQLKADCLLNGEKLDYNYQILKKREEENIIMRSHQKRLINKLQDEISGMKNALTKYRQKSNDDIEKLTLDIKKASNSMFQIEKKADGIAQINDRRYHEVWNLNEEMITSLLDKILTTDRIIHEQLLGFEWKSPKKILILKKNLQSYKEAVLAIQAKKGENLTKADQNAEATSSPQFVRAVLEKIAFRCNFLVERQVLELIPELSDEERELIKIDNVFNALGVMSNDEFKYMMDFFLQYVRCPVCEKFTNQTAVTEKSTSKSEENVASADSEIQVPQLPDVIKVVSESVGIVTNIVNSELQEEELFVEEESLEADVVNETEPERIKSDLVSKSFSKLYLQSQIAPSEPAVICKLNHPVYIEAPYVFKGLKEFVAAHQAELGGRNKTIAARLVYKRLTISRLLSPDDVKQFWEQFLNIFTKGNEDLWNNLLLGLKKYYAILQDRHSIYEELKLLRSDNEVLYTNMKKCPYQIKQKFEKKQRKAKKRF